MINNNKGQSEVVTTVLLILIAIVAITVLAIFAINFVKNQIEKSKCFDVLDLIEIKNNPSYTCFNTTGSNVRVQIHLAETQGLLEGFTIEVGGADTQTFKILNNSVVSGVQMYSGETSLFIPGDNSERTYKISGITTKPDTLKAYPVLKGGKVCQSSNNLNTVPYCP